MDAIHLATALTIREDLGAVFVYDANLHAAAPAHQLNALAPRLGLWARPCRVAVVGGPTAAQAAASLMPITGHRPAAA